MTLEEINQAIDRLIELRNTLIDPPEETCLSYPDDFAPYIKDDGTLAFDLAVTGPIKENLNPGQLVKKFLQTEQEVIIEYIYSKTIHLHINIMDIPSISWPPGALKAIKHAIENETTSRREYIRTDQRILALLEEVLSVINPQEATC